MTTLENIITTKIDEALQVDKELGFKIPEDTKCEFLYDSTIMGLITRGYTMEQAIKWKRMFENEK